MAEIERIRFLRQMVGPRVNWRVGDKVFVGEEHRMDPDEARRLVDAGYAEILRGDAAETKADAEPEPEPEIETATVGPEENAATRTRRPSRRKSKRSKK